MTTEWMQEVRALKSLAVKNNSNQVFLQPIYEGKSLVLEYRNLKLLKSSLSEKTIKLLRSSGVPRFLITEAYKNWGGVLPKTLYVRGLIIASRKDKKKKYFVATEVCGENDVEYHNQITSLNLLFARNFFTLTAECSWMHTEKLNPTFLKLRLKAKENLRIESRNGGVFAPNPPVGLKAYDCMGWIAPTKSRTKSKPKGKAK